MKNKTDLSKIKDHKKWAETFKKRVALAQIPILEVIEKTKALKNKN